MHAASFGVLLMMLASAGEVDEAGWVARLGDTDPQVAQGAVGHFVREGAAAVPVLRRALQGKDVLVQQYAAVALARIAKPGADETLMHLLRTSEDHLLVQFCAEALAARGQEIVPLLRHALELDRPCVPPASDTLALGPPDDYTPGDTPMPPEVRALLRRLKAFDVVHNLPPGLALPLCADYVSRPEGNRYGTVTMLLAEHGAKGLRLWAKSYMTATGLPGLAAANAAWDEGRDAWRHFRIRWDIGSRVLISGGTRLVEGTAAQAALRQVLGEALRSDAATERVWALNTLDEVVPSPGEAAALPDELALRLLGDPCWVVPLLVMDQLPSPERGDQALLTALRGLLQHPCKAVRSLAVVGLAEVADGAAPEVLEQMLRHGSAGDREAAGRIIAADAEDWTEAQRLRFAEPLAATDGPRPWLTCWLALSAMPPAAWPAAARLLDSPDPDARMVGTHALGEIGAPEAAPRLRAALDDAVPQVREGALAALASTLHTAAAPDIQRVFDRGDANSRLAACRAARIAQDPALLARLILAHPEVVLGSGDPSEDWERERVPGIPVLAQAWSPLGVWTPPASLPAIIPEMLAVARRLFADETQPERVRVVAAEAILAAGLASDGGRDVDDDPGEDAEAPPVPKPGGEREARDKPATVLADPPPGPGGKGPPQGGPPMMGVLPRPLPPELWPVLEFALRHFPRGICWSPNEAEPIVDAVRRVRSPEAVPVLVSLLRSAYGPDRTDSDGVRTSDIIAALLRTRPQGEAAFWQLLAEGDESRQIGMLLDLHEAANSAPALFDRACGIVLQRMPQETDGLTQIAYLLPADASSAPLLRQALWKAFQSAKRAALPPDLSAHRTPTDPAPTDYLSALLHLGDLAEGVVGVPDRSCPRAPRR